MLDDFCSQASGMHSMSLQPAPRIIAVAGHDDPASELPLLWSLCASWTKSAYSVAVLDAMSVESADNPGLDQLLDNAYWHARTDTGDSSWQVHPAAHGLQRLCQQDKSGTSALQQLSRLFHNHDVIVIFASADFITTFMSDSGIDPLLPVSANERAILTAYQALKRMLRNTELQPTIVPVVNGLSTLSSHNMTKSLQDCAMTFLGHQLSTLTVRVPSIDEPTTDETRHLACRLLENSVPMYRTASLAPEASVRGESNPLRRSH